MVTKTYCHRFPAKPWTVCIIIIFLLIMPLSLSIAQNGWELVKDADNIVVYRRQVNSDTAGEFKAVCEIDARIEEIATVLENISGQKEWVEYLLESRLIKTMGENKMLLYHLYDFIWPLQNRDCVAEIAVQENYRAGSINIIMTGINSDSVPLKKRTVRIPEWKSQLRLEYLNRERTRAVYVSQFDLGGYLPDWLAAVLSREIPYRFLKRLGLEAQKEKYKVPAQKSEYRRRIEESIKMGYLLN